MASGSYSFGKEHRLCGKSLIERLYSEGRSFIAYPFRCTYLIVERESGKNAPAARVLVSVGKRKHKKAVARNLLKRRTREAYRMSRELWDGTEIAADKAVIVGLSYLSEDILEFTTINDGVRKAILSIRKGIQRGLDIHSGITD